MHAYLVRDGHAKFVSYVACLFDKDRPEPPMNGTEYFLSVLHASVYKPSYTVDEQIMCCLYSPTAIFVLQFLPYRPIKRSPWNKP